MCGYVCNKHASLFLSSSLAIICALYLVVSIVFVFGNGVYLVQLLDQAASTLPLLFIAFFEVIAVAWVYGTRRCVSVCVCVCARVCVCVVCSGIELLLHPLKVF